jgi:hypothetical protein
MAVALLVVTRGPDLRVHHRKLLFGWIAGASSSKTRFALLPGNDEVMA